MTSTCWGLIPIYKEPLNWMIRLEGRTIQLNEDVIDLIQKDPLHVWGWYDARITQAWAEIAPAIQDKGCFVLPLLTYMISLQEISHFWNFHTDVPKIDGIHCPLRVRCQPSPERMLVQFLKEVYCATLLKFEKRKVLLSTPILLNWAGNQKALKLVQPAKCIPHFKMLIQCSKMRGTGFLTYQFAMEAIRNSMWEMWPDKAWNSLEVEGTLFLTHNPPFMLFSEIGLNILT